MVYSLVYLQRYARHQRTLDIFDATAAAAVLPVSFWQIWILLLIF